MKLKILIVAILAMASFASMAQTIEIVYDYDDAGNRIQREYKVIPANPPAIVSDTENTDGDKKNEPEVYEDFLAEKQLKIYPNPTRGRLKIEMVNYNVNVEGSIQVFDMGGRIIKNITNLSESMDIDITSQPAGSYIMVIVIGNERSEWKVIKQ